MSTTSRSEQYRCFNECEVGGCPTHEITFTYNNTSDSFNIEVDSGPAEGIQYIDMNVLSVLHEFLETAGFPTMPAHPHVVVAPSLDLPGQ